MRVLHLLASGEFGGIESLMRSYSSKSQLDNVFVFVWGAGSIYDDMCAQGAKCVNIKEENGRFLHTVVAIIKKCDEIRPDVVVTHHDVAQFKAVLVYLKFFRPQIRTIAYAHENGADIAKNGNKIKSFLTKMINKIGFHCADSVVAISESVKKSIEDVFKVSNTKIKVIYNGTDIHKIDQKIRHNFSNGVKLLYVGRLIEEKGVQTTIAALGALPDYLNWTFDIVGDGSYRKNLEKQVNELKLTKKINFLGACNNVPEVLNNHDIFIHMPCWEEGFGITIIEAMAAGMICVCLKKGGIPEIIESGKDGILVNSKEELVRMLRTILSTNQDKQIEDISSCAMKKAEIFQIERFATELDSHVIEVNTK